MTKKVGRPKSGGLKRTNRMTIPLNDEERDKVKAYAAENSLTLREVLLKGIED